MVSTLVSMVMLGTFLTVISLLLVVLFFSSFFSGTARMGSAEGGDPMAVVDGELRVIGMDGLHVVDTSVMPNVVSKNEVPL